MNAQIISISQHKFFELSQIVFVEHVSVPVTTIHAIVGFK